MAATKLDPLIPPPHPQAHHQAHQAQHPNYVVLTPYNNSNNNSNSPWWDPPRRQKNLYISTLIILVIIGSTIFTCWPSDPDLEIMRLRLRHVKIHTHPHIAVDFSLATTVKVYNKDLYSIKYTSLDVAIGYRGKVLGHVTSGGGHVRARGSSYVDATLEFNGVEVISDWIHLIHDLAKGFIQFDTISQVDGSLGLFIFQVPIRAKISCEIDVNTKNQTVTHQNCYPEAATRTTITVDDVPTESWVLESPDIYNLAPN